MPATNLATYVELADSTASRLTSSHREWTGFLKTAARLYKYPYHEQMMIYAQRPDATACAEYDIWNNRMRRYIRRGSKGIALLDTSGDTPNITVAGFETTDRRDFFDLAVGNVPFGNYKVADRAYDKLGFNIHDYFFAKAIDQVRPGGVIAFVTSKGTMDKQMPRHTRRPLRGDVD